jgi:hypothetical protein
MSHRSRHSELGFSLVEVFVATAIFAVIFIAALLVYDRSNKIFKSGVEASDLQQNTRVAFDKMLSDVRLTGFDYDRDGVPTALGESQQPDEQIEYAGRSALTIRGNFNYNDANNGRVTALELPASQFPIVTTGNDEIVTYALVPDSPTAVTESMTFYADVTDGSVAKRQSYPGGSAEDTITISGIDLCDDDKNGDSKIGCEQPPYTLYRFTVNDAGGVDRTPLANNVRDLQFQYFNDITGTTVLAVTDPGGGKYDPTNAATLNHAARVKRAEIKAIRISVVGLNNSPDPAWTQPGELIASVKNRRQYTLESMVIPRNLGKRGMREQQTMPPGSPTLSSVCFNYCGLVQVNWAAPASSASTGEVETYHVLWDTDTGKTMTSPPASTQTAGLATTTMLSSLDPNVEYRFSVAATNSYGTAYATTQVIGKPLNATTPQPPKLTGTSNSTNTMEKNLIRVDWTLPTANVSPNNVASCKTPAGVTNAQVVQPQTGEMQGIEIWRGTDPFFDPAAGAPKAVMVASASASAGTFNDTTAANCVKYYYRIRVMEFCGNDPNKNVGIITGISDYDPPVGSKGIEGEAKSTEKPSTPGPLTVNVAASSCAGFGPAAVCSVSMSWPQVKTDTTGVAIAVDSYDVQIVSAAGTSIRTISLANGDATVAGGVVTFVATGLLKTNPSTLSDYVYTFSARATQCGQQGDFSVSDTYPKCVFAGGATLTATISGKNAGTGTAPDPFEILGAEVMTFSVPAAATKNLVKVEASIYNVATGALVTTLPVTTGSGKSLTVNWPDSGDNTNFRVDYTVTDSSTPGCTQSGSFYVRETVVSCPFQAISAPATTKLDDPPLITFPLQNLTDFDVTFVKAEFTWDKPTAHATRAVDVGPVTLPSGAGSGTVNATLTGNLSSTGTFTAASSSAAKIFANDMTGNYLIKLNFSVTGNKDMQGQPINGIVIFYTLPGDVAADGVRQCNVF